MTRPHSGYRTWLSIGGEPAARKANARYALSLARRMGCPVFLTWEDIVQVRPKAVELLPYPFTDRPEQSRPTPRRRRLDEHSFV